VQVLGQKCFSNAVIKRIAFEADSELARIEEFGFENCPLPAICIPANVNSIPGSAFIDCKCNSVVIDSHSEVMQAGLQAVTKMK
jgi:hypothetical protein